MINGDILKQYQIEPKYEVSKLKQLLIYVEIHNQYYYYEYRAFLIKFYASSMNDVIDRVNQNTVTLEEEMLHLIRTFLEFENPLNFDTATREMLLHINYYKNLIDRLNYSYIFDINRNEIILFKKDTFAEIVATNPNLVNLKWRLYEFNMIGSTLEDKIDTLREIYVYFEENGLRSNKYVNETMRYLNVTRHGNYKQDPTLLAKYQSDKTKEKFLQLCFKMSIQSFINVDIESINSEINGA